MSTDSPSPSFDSPAFDSPDSPVSPAPPAELLHLGEIKRTSTPVRQNPSASLWDIGDGVLCLEFTSKMNAMDADIFALERETVSLIGDGSQQWKALVIYNEGNIFSAGANLRQILASIHAKDWQAIESFIADGQKTYHALKFAPFPVVSAPHGLALGGGCEILLHSDHIQAHSDVRCGLVEVGVGFIPGWGGCKEFLLRMIDRFSLDHLDEATEKAFDTIRTARLARSPQEAKEIGYFRESDGITRDRARLLTDAKTKALELVREGYTPPQPRRLSLGGLPLCQNLKRSLESLEAEGKVTPYEKTISALLADVLTGCYADASAPCSEEDLFAAERRVFVELAKKEGTAARIDHMLTTGKPLGN